MKEEKDIPKVTLQELKEFLFSLPDNTPMDMSNPFYNEGCGCLMTQYGKSKGWECNESDAWGGWRNSPYDYVAELVLETCNEDEHGVFSLFDGELNNNHRMVRDLKGLLK